MQKPFTVILSILVASFSVSAQESSNKSVQLGIKVSPTISFARITDKKDDDGTQFSNGGAAGKLVVGPYVDFGINSNVTFSTGLWYSPRAVVLKAKSIGIDGNETTSKSTYNLQYVMLPLYFKFNTNELTPGMKLYITMGGSFDVKLAEKVKGDDNIGLKELAKLNDNKLFSAVDASVMFGTGVEIKFKEITTFFVGVSYNRGILNVVNPLFKYDVNGSTEKPYQHLSIKNNLFSLDLGMKF